MPESKSADIVSQVRVLSLPQISQELVLDLCQPCLPRRRGINAEHHPNPIFETRRRTRGMPFPSSDGAHLIRTIIWPCIGLHARTEGGGYSVGARVAGAKHILVTGASPNLLFPNEIDFVGKPPRALFDQRPELDRVRHTGDDLMLIRGKKSEVGPELTRLRKLEGVFELIAEQAPGAAGVLLKPDKINLRLPPIGERMSDRKFSGATTREDGARVLVLIAAQFDFRLRGEDVRRVDDVIVRVRRHASEQKYDSETHISW